MYRAEKQEREDSFDIVEQTFEQDVDLLRKWIREIQVQLKARGDLRDYFLNELDENVSHLYDYIHDIKHWEPGYKPSVDQRRSSLERELLDLREERRTQVLSFWRDVSDLEKELRTLEQEYEKAKRRKELLDM